MKGPMEFGVRVRRLCNRDGITQIEMSRKTRIDTRRISAMIAGREYPKFWEMLEIGKFFNVSLDWLAYGERNER